MQKINLLRFLTAFISCVLIACCGVQNLGPQKEVKKQLEKDFKMVDNYNIQKIIVSKKGITAWDDKNCSISWKIAEKNISRTKICPGTGKKTSETWVLDTDDNFFILYEKQNYTAKEWQYKKEEGYDFNKKAFLQVNFNQSSKTFLSHFSIDLNVDKKVMILNGNP